MIRKTALMTGIAGLMLTAAPAAFAQDAQPTPAPTPAPAEAPAAAPAQSPGTLTLQPGSDVKGSDGAVLGKLEGVRSNAGAQELTVRGADGQVKGVPLAGLKPEGTGVSVGWTLAEFTAAPAIPGAPDAASSSAPASTPAAEQTSPDATSPEPSSTAPTTTDAPSQDSTDSQEPATPPVQPQA